MSVQTEIQSRTTKLAAILANANTAITGKDGTAAADLNGIPAAIAAIPKSEPRLQARTVTPTGKTFAVSPASGYDGLSSVTVAGDSNLAAENIVKDVTIYGVTGTHECEGGGGSAIPEPYATYIAEAEEVYTGEYANVIYAEGYGKDTGVTYHTVMFLLDNWQITAYDAATTAYTHGGFMMVSKEDDGAWTLTDYSNTTTDTHYAKNIKAASLYIEYEGMTLFPVGINNYPDTVAIDYSNWDNGSFSETLETGDKVDYAVEFDASERPIEITLPNGATAAITWEASE